MALITDAAYVIHKLRLSHLRHGNDALSAGIIDLGESASGDGPWIRATGGRDVERWPELQTCHSPIINAQASSSRAPALHHQRSNLQRALSTWKPRAETRQPSPPAGSEGAQLAYRPTIVGAGRALAGGAGYRVSGIRAVDSVAVDGAAASTKDGRPRLRTTRASESSFARPQVSRPLRIQTSVTADGSSLTRKRSDSEPIPGPHPGAAPSPLASSFSSRTPGRAPADEEGDSQHDSTAYSTLGEDEGEEFLENYTALEAEDEGLDEGANGFADGVPTLDQPLRNRPSERPRRDVDVGGLPNEAGNDSDGELDIEREQEDLLDGFREEIDVATGRGLDNVGDRPEEKLPIEGAADDSSRMLRFALKPPLEAQTSFSHHKVPLKSSSEAKPSGLSMLLKASESKTLAPFAAYARILPPPVGPGGTSTPVPTLHLSLYFPHSDQPNKPLKTLVRKVSTVEEVVGLGLYLFEKEGRKPALEDGLDEEGSREWEIKLSTRGWGLRIVEDDGEVDEDFPALDRDASVAKFSFLEFAITKATPTQIEQNIAKNPLPARPAAETQPSNMSVAPPPSTLGVAQSSFTNGSFQATSPVLRPSAAPGIPVLLKINVRGSGSTRFTTTISVPSATYLADVVELICKKRQMDDPPKDWVLCLADLSFVLPTDRTVESLMGVTDLALVKRSWAASHGLKGGGQRGGDPNASVFKDFHEQRRELTAISGLDSPYQKFIVHRKAPIGRHERVLAIDGDYIHLMPPEGRALGFTASVRTSSFNIASIVNVKQSRKSPQNLKIAVAKDTGTKTYELEAENPRIASDIVTIIKDLMRLYPAVQRREASNLLVPLSPNKIRRRPPGV